MKGGGILHFYTEDYRFSTIYEHPEEILTHNPANIVEPKSIFFNATPTEYWMQGLNKKSDVAKAMKKQKKRLRQNSIYWSSD